MPRMIVSGSFWRGLEFIQERRHKNKTRSLARPLCALPKATPIQIRMHRCTIFRSRLFTCMFFHIQYREYEEGNMQRKSEEHPLLAHTNRETRFLAFFRVSKLPRKLAKEDRKQTAPAQPKRTSRISFIKKVNRSNKVARKCKK